MKREDHQRETPEPNAGLSELELEHAAEAEEAVAREEDVEREEDAPSSHRKIGRAYKAYGIFCLILGGAVIAATAAIVIMILVAMASGNGLSTIVSLAKDLRSGANVSTMIITAISAGLSVVLAFGYFRLGLNLLRDRRRHAGTLANGMIALVVVNLLCTMMLEGVGTGLIIPCVNLVALVIISAFVDPALAQERELKRKLRDMEYREQEEAGGRDLTGQGYITLNFFNLFWIFVVASVLGLIIEEVYHALLYGGYQDRAGLLYGPFSPIYGLGCVLMTMALNRFYKSNPVFIFAVAAVIGGAFEFFVSWFFQTAFGITAWDYSGPWFNDDGSINLISFMNIDGRTSLIFMIFWGIMGLFWIKLALPPLLKLINLIPWNVRYTVTAVAAVLMIADGALTLIACDCWYERVAGREPTQPIELFCAQHYDNEFMQNRFQTMSIDPSNTTRVD